MSTALERLVWQRAGSRCECCQLSQAYSPLPHAIDHIVARQHGGPTEPENLALACFFCNSDRGPNISGINPQTGRAVRLFNTRKDRWSRHFVLISEDSFKYLRIKSEHGGREECYDLINDPGELQNLASPENEERVAPLRDMRNAVLDDSEAAPGYIAPIEWPKSARIPHPRPTARATNRLLPIRSRNVIRYSFSTPGSARNRPLQRESVPDRSGTGFAREGGGAVMMSRE